MKTEKTLTEQGKEKHKGNFAGDFVLKNQKMAEAFTHVNKEWLSKTLTFEEMLKRGREFQAQNEDIEGATLNDISVKNGNLVLFGNNAQLVRVLKLNDHSLSQLGLRADVPGSYLGRLAERDVNLMDLNLNRGLEYTSKTEGNKGVFLRTRKQEGGTEVVRALLSNRYAVLDNLPVVETLGDAVPGGRVSHLYYDGDTFRANILIPDSIRSESDSDYGGGISVINNETGKLTFSSRPFVFRAICFNGNIWDDVQGVEIVRKHLGKIDWKEFRKKLVLNIHSQIPLIQENIEKVLNLKGLPVTEQEIQQAIVYLGRKEKMTQETARAWYKGFQTELNNAATAKDILNVFGVVQGLTRAAQEQKFETQELMESLSGRLVDAKWDRILSAAVSDVTAEEAKEVLVE